MTHEQLLGFTAKELASMSDAQLAEVYKEALNITRPDRAPKINKSPDKKSSNLASKQQETLDLLKAAGINLDIT